MERPAGSDAAVQWAKNLELTVIGTAAANGKELVKAQGATHGFDHSDKNYLDGIKETTSGAAVE